MDYLSTKFEFYMRYDRCLTFQCSRKN